MPNPGHVIIHMEQAKGTLFRQASDLDTLRKSKHVDNISLDPTPSSITMVGHSNDQLFYSNKTVSYLSAKQFADKIAKKIKTPDRNRLQHFYLLSCEAGLKINGNPSYAEEFSKKMFSLGFTNLKVHAMTTDRKDIKAMNVTWDGEITSASKISCEGYRTAKDRLDAIEIRKEIDKNNPKDPFQLKKDLERIEVRLCSSQNYQEVMNLPQHTFTNGKQGSTLLKKAQGDSKDEAPLNNFLASDGIFDHLVRFITGTHLFNKQLARYMAVLKQGASNIEAEEKKLELQVKKIEKPKTSRNTIVSGAASFFGFSSSPTPSDSDPYSSLNTAFITALADKPIPATKIKIMVAYQKFQDSFGKQGHNQYDDICTDLIEHTNRRIELDEIKSDLKEFIQQYISRYSIKEINLDETKSITFKGRKASSQHFKKDTKEIHQDKARVMFAINSYLQNPTDETWQRLKKTKENNPLWNQGFFSKVNAVMKQVEAFKDAHESLKKQGDTESVIKTVSSKV